MAAFLFFDFFADFFTDFFADLAFDFFDFFAGLARLLCLVNPTAGKSLARIILRVVAIGGTRILRSYAARIYGLQDQHEHVSGPCPTWIVELVKRTSAPSIATKLIETQSLGSVRAA